jgi:crotonobetainyl-CoA:carnitine CoA-transferase CaiB-like acyl-CoA transferase
MPSIRKCFGRPGSPRLSVAAQFGYRLFSPDKTTTKESHLSEVGPLAGISVVDLTTTVMGPYCTLLLAQMGADVIKVEPPGGDLTRWTGDRHGDGMSPLFLNVNRGKRSIVVDLKDGAGYEVLMRLAARADVFVHNMRPGATARLGLSYAAVTAANPGCVYCELHGFGAGGPYQDKPAYDDVIQAVSGLAAIQGGDGTPAYVRSLIADKTAGLTALSAILAALYERGRTGTGQAIEVPMFETMAAYTLIDQQGGWVFDPPDGPAGYVRTSSPHRQPYRTRDGYIAVMAYTDAQWRAFFQIIGEPQLADAPQYRSITERTKHINELYALVADEVSGRTTEDWLTVLEAAHIPAVPVRTIPDLFADPHVTAVGLVEPVDHPTQGRLRQARLPITFSRSNPATATPAPGLGEHGTQILAELGYRPEEVTDLSDLTDDAP